MLPELTVVTVTGLGDETVLVDVVGFVITLVCMLVVTILNLSKLRFRFGISNSFVSIGFRIAFGPCADELIVGFVVDDDEPPLLDDVVPDVLAIFDNCC